MSFYFLLDSMIALAKEAHNIACQGPLARGMSGTLAR